MRRTGCTVAFTVVFLLIWCTATFGADAVAAWAVARQCWTFTFETTTGTITRSEVKRREDAKGRVYRFVVGYDYTVNGRPLTGERYRYGNMGTSEDAWRRVQEELPVGAAMPVYYDAGDPTEAVLVRGPQGSDLFLFWFLTPFNVIAVGGLRFVLRGGRPAFVPTDPRVIARTDAGWRFRPYARRWRFYFAMALIFLPFVGSLGVAVAVAVLPALVALAVAFAAGFGLAAAIANHFAGRVTFEVDEFQRTATAYPRKAEPVTVPLAAVTGFTVESQETDASDPEGLTRHYAAVRVADVLRPIRVAEYLEPESAEAVADELAAAIRASAAGSGSPG